jgi:hypothetical protein
MITLSLPADDRPQTRRSSPAAQRMPGARLIACNQSCGAALSLTFLQRHNLGSELAQRAQSVDRRVDQIPQNTYDVPTTFSVKASGI